MTTFVDLDSGQVIGVVDGRDSAAVKTWLKRRPRWWRHRVRVVAIDPSAAFRSAVRSWLPKARVSVDHFHLVKLANDMLTAVRRRVSWDTHDRRGRKTDPAWAHRLLLLRGYAATTPSRHAAGTSSPTFWPAMTRPTRSALPGA